MNSRVKTIAFNLQGISLKWKLLIPFLSLAFLGTVILVYIGLTSQYHLIQREERREIKRAYEVFLSEIENKKIQMLSMASVIAEDPQVARLLAAKDRRHLLRMLQPIFERLKDRFGISLIHVHVPPGRSFLRLHAPERHGEMLAYRKSVVEALRSKEPVTALEWGLAGLAIRGVSPVLLAGRVVGSVEVGYPFGGPFLSKLKQTWGPDFTVYEKRGKSTYVRLASTSESGGVFIQLKDKTVPRRKPRILVAPREFPKISVLIGPILDYYGEIVGAVEIDIDRSKIEKSLSHTKKLMFLAGSIGIVLSFLLTWLIASIFVRPIRHIVKQAEEIAEGVRETRLEERPPDEMGHLSRALNKMLESLQARQKQIEEYARTLEQRVRERTTDLVDSEEKYRTLVDNLPLVVYRLQADGTVEFINPYFTEKLGYDPEEVVGNREFWRNVICKGQDPAVNIIEACWGKKKEMRTERKVKSKAGQVFVFIDQAIPMREDSGNIKWIDGIMLDITELKRLQERALRGEEIRILGEMSARFAHELRNPLVTAGGFARRLLNKLPEGSEYRKFAEIIVEEVSRLENVLRIMLSTIEPVELSLTEVDPLKVLRACKKDLETDLNARNITLDLQVEEDLPLLKADEGLILKALESLLQHAMATMPVGERIILSAKVEDGSIVVRIVYKCPGLDEEDIEQFFLPRQVEMVRETVLDLPLSKIIVHRHGGMMDVSKVRGSDQINIKIELPVKER